MYKRILIAIIVVFIIILVIGGILLLTIISNNNNNNDTKTNYTTETQENKVVKDAHISGYMSINEDYIVYIEKDNEDKEEYKCNADNIELLTVLSKYDEVKVDIYYVEDNNTKTIIKYEIYNTETNEIIEDIKNEEELRKEIGYYTIGTYKDELTLVELDDTPGFNFEDEYTYYDYIFKNREGKTYEMRYKIYKGTENNLDIFQKNKKYIVIFDVEKGKFDYEITIKEITPKT